MRNLLSDDLGVDRLESFGAKFARLQNTLVDKRIPAVLQQAGECVGAAIDNLDAQIESACRDAQANAGHHALARMAPRYERFCVLTQNVDGFHRDAGSADLIEMHGNIHRLHCTHCAHAWSVIDYAHIAALPPRCDRCSGVVRPAVVLFGEWLPQDAIERYETVLRQGFDLVMAVGTSAVFAYIAAPVQDTWHRGGDTLEINPQATDISPFCRIAVRHGAADALTRIERVLAAGG